MSIVHPTQCSHRGPAHLRNGIGVVRLFDAPVVWERRYKARGLVRGKSNPSAMRRSCRLSLSVRALLDSHRPGRQCRNDRGGQRQNQGAAKGIAERAGHSAGEEGKRQLRAFGEAA
jgi:hypothetical protein